MKKIDKFTLLKFTLKQSKCSNNK